MAIWRNRFFLVCLGSFLLFHVSELLGYDNPFLSSYLDDVLAMPLILTTILFTHRFFLEKNQNYCLPVSHIIVSVIFISLVFEILLPGFSGRYTRDFFDIILYSIGAVLFKIWINIPITTSA